MAFAATSLSVPGAELHALAHQARAQRVRVHERAVVRKRDQHFVDGRDMRLRSLPRRRGAACGVPGVPHGYEPVERCQARFVEHLRDQAQVLGNHNGFAVAHRNARAFLPAMLKRLQAEARHTGNVLALAGSEHAEYGALLLKAIGALARKRSHAHEAISFDASPTAAAASGSAKPPSAASAGAGPIVESAT